MDFDLKSVFEKFEKLKEGEDNEEYFDEIIENNNILSTNPFDVQKARQQISKLATKYKPELNMLAQIYNNGMAVTNKQLLKASGTIYYELEYISNHIPLFALERKGITNYLKKKIDLQ